MIGISVIVLIICVQAQLKRGHDHSHSNRRQLEAREVQHRDRWYWQMPTRVLDEIGVTEGQTVGDVGCGIGYFSLRLAKAVGESGMVYASDIDGEALNYLDEKCQENGVRNIKTVRGDKDDPRLPEATVDMVLIVNTINFVTNPSLFLNNIKLSLKPGGRVVFVQWDAEKMDPEMPNWSAENRSKFTRQTMLRTIYDANYEVVRMLDFLPMQMIYICQPRAVESRGEQVPQPPPGPGIGVNPGPATNMEVMNR
jgi:ubiquinone/menaquinone biosynthesis C-methylase UbiE